MHKSLIKSRIHCNKHKPKIKQEVNNTKSTLRHIYNQLNKNYYQAMALLNRNKNTYTYMSTYT